VKSHMGIWKIIVFTNLLIACAAGAQVLLSYLIFQIPYNSTVVLLEFSATLLLYNLSIWISKPKDYISSPYERTRWIFGNMHVFWTLNAIVSLLLFYTLTQIHFHTFLYLGFIGVLSLAYALPILKIHGQWKNFRHVPYIKVFHIALIWSLSTVGLVYIEHSNNLQAVEWTNLLYVLSCKFLFILLVTLPFDIRDMKQDSYYHLKTVPLALGQVKAQNLCYMLGLVHILLVLAMPTTSDIKIGLIVCDVLVLILFKTKIFKEQNSFLNVYLLDLVLVIQYLFCLFSIQIAYNLIR
jgi:4-hydroxybenzoate polyprenyltransferase